LTITTSTGTGNPEFASSWEINVTYFNGTGLRTSFLEKSTTEHPAKAKITDVAKAIRSM
jgi:hypothetical protein